MEPNNLYSTGSNAEEDIASPNFLPTNVMVALIVIGIMLISSALLYCLFGCEREDLNDI